MLADHVTPEGQAIVSSQHFHLPDLSVPLSVSEEIVTTTDPPRIGKHVSFNFLNVRAVSFFVLKVLYYLLGVN